MGRLFSPARATSRPVLLDLDSLGRHFYRYFDFYRITIPHLRTISKKHDTMSSFVFFSLQSFE
jgi:hypothetical protein